MRVTTYGRYGVRSMFDLAMYRNIGPISLKTISLRQSISIDYLEQIMGKLRKAGLVKSIRGPKGGFILAKSPETIKISDILTAVNESYTPVHCVVDEKGKSKKCPRIEECIAHLLWMRLGENIKQFLEKITLEDLRREAKERWGMEYPDHQYMYYL